jgi:uncharacterized protein with LGFP repeats
VISQQFTGGKISWNRAKNTFSTEPSNLAPLLSGLQVSGQDQPSNSAMPAHAKKSTWHWWWLVVAIPVLALLVLLAWVLFGGRRRRLGHEDAAAYAPGNGGNFGYDADERWGHDDADVGADPFGLGATHQPEPEPDAGRVSWQRQIPAESDYRLEEEDPDAVDTDSIPVVSEEMLSEAEYSEAGADYTDYTDAVPEVAEPERADDAAYVDADGPDAGYLEEAYPEDEYPDVVPSTPPEGDAVDGALETAEPEDEYLDLAAPEPDVEAEADTATEADVADTAVGAAVVADAVAAGPPARSGRHAADDTSESGLAGPNGRPTIHLPLDDPYQAPEGYPIKASARYGLYYMPGSDLYQDTLAEIWLSSEEVAQANGFTRAD